LDGEDMIKDGRSLDSLDKRGDRHRYSSSSFYDNHYDLHRYHPYRRSDKEYLSDEFKKEKTPTFDGEMKK